MTKRKLLLEMYSNLKIITKKSETESFNLAKYSGPWLRKMLQTELRCIPFAFIILRWV